MQIEQTAITTRSMQRVPLWRQQASLRPTTNPASVTQTQSDEEASDAPAAAVLLDSSDGFENAGGHEREAEGELEERLQSELAQPST